MPIMDIQKYDWLSRPESRYTVCIQSKRRFFNDMQEIIMLAKLPRVVNATRYTRSFIPVSDALLRPYEAETAALLTHRTTRDSGTADYVAAMRLAQEERRAYLAEAMPRWRRAAAHGIKAALSRTAAGLRAAVEALWESLESVQRARRESWLAQATDAHDVERRIRAMERNAVRGWY